LLRAISTLGLVPFALRHGDAGFSPIWPAKASLPTSAIWLSSPFMAELGKKSKETYFSIN
jgi:hypothetical protein